MLSRDSTTQKSLYVSVLIYTVCVYGTMAMMSIGAGLVAGVFILSQRNVLRDSFSRVRESPFFLPTIFFGFACAWSLIWARASGLKFYGYRPTIDWAQDLRKLWHLFFPFVLMPALTRLETSKLRTSAKVWMYAGLASAVVGVIQYYVPLLEVQDIPHALERHGAPAPGAFGFLVGKYHANGLAGFHLSYASILAFPAGVWLALFAVLIRREGLKKRALLAGSATSLCMAAAFASYSKIAWIAFPVMAVVIGFAGLKGRFRWVVVSGVVVAAVSLGSSSELRARFRNPQTLVDRLQVWEANVEMVLHYPLFGVGWHRNSELSHGFYRSRNQFAFESHAHNNILDQWATTGLFGVFGFVWLNALLGYVALRIYRYSHDLVWRALALGFVGGWVCLHLNGLTQANWWDAKVLHQIGWVTAFTMELFRRMPDAAPRLYKS